jgi:large subunit ribosomal protein L13
MRHTGYPGGQRTLTAKVLQSKNPALLVSCKRNVTKNKIGAELLKFKCCCRFRAQTRCKAENS